MRCVDASDVNAYLKAHAGDDYTAKDFRTWGATVVAANAMLAEAQPANERQATRSINAAIRKAADTLGNTLAVCRRSYVHPGVLDHALARAVAKRRRPRVDRLSPEECRALAMLDAASQPLDTKLRRSIAERSAQGARARPRAPMHRSRPDAVAAHR